MHAPDILRNLGGRRLRQGGSDHSDWDGRRAPGGVSRETGPSGQVHPDRIATGLPSRSRARQIGPGEEPGVMAVVEDEAHGIVADRLDSAIATSCLPPTVSRCRPNGPAPRPSATARAASRRSAHGPRHPRRRRSAVRLSGDRRISVRRRHGMGSFAADRHAGRGTASMTLDRRPPSTVDERRGLHLDRRPGVRMPDDAPADMIDPFGRAISYLRVSVTDRCDFRCVYCMAEDMTFLPKQDLLTLEELDRLCSRLRRQGRPEAAPDRRRAAGAQEHHAPGPPALAPSRERRARRADADHQRLAAGALRRRTRRLRRAADQRLARHARPGQVPARSPAGAISARCWHGIDAAQARRPRRSRSTPWR